MQAMLEASTQLSWRDINPVFPKAEATLTGTAYFPFDRAAFAQYFSADLSARLWQTVSARPDWVQLLHRQKMAIGLVDLSVLARPRVAWINGQTLMYAASLPKIGILYAAAQAMEKGQLAESDALMQDMHDMIRYSNNAAATRMIDRLGGLRRVDAALGQSREGFYDSRAGGIWVGKRYASEGGRDADPLRGMVHTATVEQVCRFYYLLATRQVINEKRSEQMLAALAQPGLYHKFIYTLGSHYPLNRLYRKSGTWKQWHADSVLVWGEQASKRYILVALVEDPNGGAILRALPPLLEPLLAPPVAVADQN